MCLPFVCSCSCTVGGGEFINSYAMFMGYVSMSIRGLGYLVLTWTTVVLLGGFVSLLQEKDFWALTVITLVQTTGIFNVSLEEKLKNICNSLEGLLLSMFEGEDRPVIIQAAAVVAAVLQLLIVAVILLPLGAVYVFGLYISTGISLWRLIQRDYVEADGDPNKANLRPALVVLYSLGLAQGALLCYRAIFSISRRERVVLNAALKEYHLEEDTVQSVRDYFHETMAGCEKDPSFARGRNLITYAVELMGSTSSDRYLSGTKILDALLPSLSQSDDESKLLRGSESSTHLLWNLLRTLDSTAPYGAQARLRAARILEHLVGDVYLEQLPGGIQCIASLLETSPSGSQWEEALQGMRILRNLAANSGNLGAIKSAPGLLARITAPPLDHDDDQHHHGWSAVALESLVLTRRLMEAATKYKDDECLGYLKKALSNVMPKVLRHVLLQIQTEAQAPPETCIAGFSAPGTDLEEGPVSQAAGPPNPNPQQQREALKLQDALLVQCAAARDELDREDQKLACLLDEIAAQICSDAGKPTRSWAALVTEAREILEAKKAALPRRG